MYKKNNASLINIKQRKDKPLKSYLTRFNEAAPEIKDLPFVMTMHSILIELKFGYFYKSLAKKPTKTMIELLARLDKFINLEEVEVTKR